LLLWGFGVFVRREIKLPGLEGGETHGGDQLLHCSDLPPLEANPEREYHSATLTVR